MQRFIWSRRKRTLGLDATSEHGSNFFKVVENANVLNTVISAVHVERCVHRRKGFHSRKSGLALLFYTSRYVVPQ